MRETKQWREKLARKLKGQWPDEIPMSPSIMCEIELALTLYLNLAPDMPVDGVWILLTGYPFHTLQSYSWEREQQIMLGTARHLLPYYRSPFPWQRALAQYQTLPEFLSGYEICVDRTVRRREISLCSERFDHYMATLLQSPEFKKTPLQWAEAGTYEYLENRRYVSVTIPENLALSPPKPVHNLSLRHTNLAIKVRWEELIETAVWMDTQLKDSGQNTKVSWERRLRRVKLEVFDKTGTHLQQADVLTIEGILNVIGMVSSGKTTLITVLAVWAAYHDYHITLVVGDVISALDRAKLLRQFGIKTAPILGGSNRERHTNRLHRVQRAEHPRSPLVQLHDGFDWLSTACALNGLHDRMNVMDIRNRPCLDLVQAGATQAEDKQPERFACPIFSQCSFHQVQRDLVDAQIWIATPASLVYTGIAPQINPERMRFAELIYRRSDIVIVDEADQVQVQLDNIFSPNQTLASRGYTAWFNQLSQQVLPRLNQEGRAQLVEQDVEAWCSSHDMVQMATNRVYGLLLQETQLRGEIEQDYFTAWMILDRLAVRLCGGEYDTRHDHSGYRNFMNIFEGFLEDPVGERIDSELALLAQQSVTHADKARTRQRIREWIETKPDTTVNNEQELKLSALLLEFALVVAILSDRLDNLLRDWKHAEAALQLDGASSIIFHRPPDDFTAVIPVSPMGNVLAFQYIRSGSDEPGDLRFFRCLGVGRWLLLHLHDLFAGDGIAGPHVMLFSGTSWAGSSPSYHIQLPVTGILHAPEAEVEAIAQHSVFHFEPIYDKKGQPIRVSGLRGQSRLNALHDILKFYADRGGIHKDKPSRLERERDNLPEHRQRILFLVGSYLEAKLVREYLEAMRPDWRGRILNLVPDDDEFESNWQSQSGSLQRGLVHQLADTESWLLVAPLLAVERGHNILNEYDQAAIGAVYFLVRPHPRPDDIGYAIQSINRWAIDEYENKRWIYTQEGQHPTVATGEQFRETAFDRWRFLLGLPMIYSTLPTLERDAVIWSQLVTIWQVVGRLIRGGSPARVFFCDAAFAPRAAAKSDDPDQPSSSLLVGILRVLEPYFDDTIQSVTQRDKVLVRTLYGPFYQAMKRMKGLPNGIQ